MRTSLFARLVAYLLIGEFIGYFITSTAIIVLSLFGVFPSADLEWTGLGEPHATKLVINSLRKEPDGRLYIDPTPALRAYVDRTPSFRYAVYSSDGDAAVRGSSLEFASSLIGRAPVIARSMWFYLSNETASRLSGDMFYTVTPFGKLRIALYGYEFHWEDIYDFVREKISEDYMLYVPQVLIGIIVGWIALKQGLKPLNKIAQEASKIDMNSGDQRLSVDSAPSEIVPLVTSINGALERFDEGARKERRFLANAAHELRTPIAILTARLDHPEEREFVGDLKRDARKIRSIVDQLLATIRFDRRERKSFSGLDLSGLTQTLVDDRALLAVKRDRRLAFEAPDAPIQIMGDRLALESVIGNLIDNALCAEPRGGTVVVRLDPERTVSVIDHGEGVAEADREIIFEPFWRKSETTPGSGLGLSIARDLIGKHKGRIWVEDTPGGGATFKLWFPSAAEC
jgi:signal transduction histidine kinase